MDRAPPPRTNIFAGLSLSLDRSAERRDEAGWIAEQAGSAAARFLLLDTAGQAYLQRDRDALRWLDAGERATLLGELPASLLGVAAQRPHFMLALDDAAQAGRQLVKQRRALAGIDPAQGIGVTLQVGLASGVQQQEARRGGACLLGDPASFVAPFGTAVQDQAESREDVGTRWLGSVHRGRSAQAENEEPQPQVVLALGLLITNCAPLRLSA